VASMKVKYTVTYEFPRKPSLTHRGVVEAGREHVCAARAIKAARTALRPINWSSMVCVLLERLDEDAAETDAEDEGEELEGQEQAPEQGKPETRKSTAPRTKKGTFA
jgi:hypothetical protein